MSLDSVLVHEMTILKRRQCLTKLSWYLLRSTFMSPRKFHTRVTRLMVKWQSGERCTHCHYTKVSERSASCQIKNRLCGANCCAREAVTCMHITSTVL